MYENKLIQQSSGQISAEYILLLAGIIVIVLISMNIYQHYVSDFKSEINDSQVKTLLDEIDSLNSIF
ncbi:MAG: class III signal peptide-containing protein [Methanosphaera stadtmanae]|nr:class III signal peptide-containing protein [Methanosphaera stadtmanae]